MLRTSGLVTQAEWEHDAGVRLYRLERGRFTELRSWVDEVEAFWTDQLASFKAHAERKGRQVS